MGWKSSTTLGKPLLRCVYSGVHMSNMALSYFFFSLSATAEELLKEYKACESPDYITYVCRFAPRILCLMEVLTRTWYQF